MSQYEDFETYRTLDVVEITHLRRGHPEVSAGRVHYRRYRVQVELIDEPADVLLERLQKLWDASESPSHRELLEAEAERLGLRLG